MNFKTAHSKLSSLVRAWDKYPNQSSYYLKKITKVVNEMNASNLKRNERLKNKRANKVLKILLGKS